MSRRHHRGRHSGAEKYTALPGDANWGDRLNPRKRETEVRKWKWYYVEPGLWRLAYHTISFAAAYNYVYQSVEEYEDAPDDL